MGKVRSIGDEVNVRDALTVVKLAAADHRRISSEPALAAALALAVHVDRLIAEEGESIAERVERMLDESMNPARNFVPMSSTECAEILGISERTLQRRLVVEGLNWQALLDAARARRAVEIRADDPWMTVPQMARNVGFAHGPSFNRFWRRVFGESYAHKRK